VSYCSSCGELVEGRFCRMCGAPYTGAAAYSAASSYAAFADNPAELPDETNVQQPFQPLVQPGSSEATPEQQTSQEATALVAHSAVRNGQVPQPGYAQPQPESGFESLFRQPEGVFTPHSRTQLIQPVEADYRMAPPPAAEHAQSFHAGPGQLAAPPSGGYPSGPASGSREDWDDEPGVRKPVLWGTIGAVAVVSAVILGLLYIGGHNNNGGGASSVNSSTNAATAGATSQQTIPSVDLAPGPQASTPSPSASASASPSPSASVATGGTSLPLSQGSTGAYVREVQSRLRQLGYYHGQISGTYDEATARAVSAFQSAAGVNGDPSGTVGRPTLTALIAAGSRPDLKFGQRSADVKRLQLSLNSAENAGLNVNGRYDAATYAAVFRYQSQIGVPPRGSMNAQTWAALQSGTIIG
jgi:peptidoglycan hydrolase-like protein with peptidoglycan-binding domain